MRYVIGKRLHIPQKELLEMATTVTDLTGTEQANEQKIAAARGTTGHLNDPAQREGLELVTAGVNAQLVEDAGYQKVRNNGSVEVVYNHKYWYPGETRLMAPGELDNVQKNFKEIKGFSVEVINAAPQNLADLHDEHVAKVEEVSGNYFVGAKQTAAIDLQLVAPPTDEDRKASRKAADQKDEAVTAQAERDAKRPVTQTAELSDAQKAEAAKATAERDQATNKAQAAHVAAHDKATDKK